MSCHTLTRFVSWYQVPQDPNRVACCSTTNAASMTSDKMVRTDGAWWRQVSEKPVRLTYPWITPPYKANMHPSHGDASHLTLMEKLLMQQTSVKQPTSLAAVLPRAVWMRRKSASMPSSIFQQMILPRESDWRAEAMFSVSMFQGAQAVTYSPSYMSISDTIYYT